MVFVENNISILSSKYVSRQPKNIEMMALAGNCDYSPTHPPIPYPPKPLYEAPNNQNVVDSGHWRHGLEIKTFPPPSRGSSSSCSYLNKRWK